jgi:hypothetical protein
MAVLFWGASDEKTKRWDVRCLILERRSRMQGGIHVCSHNHSWASGPCACRSNIFLASIHAGSQAGSSKPCPDARGVGVRLSEATPHAEDVPSSSPCHEVSA